MWRGAKDRFPDRVTAVGLGFVALAIVWGILTFGAPPSGVSVIEGPVTHVRDGDTIEIGAVVIRLAALDCAELGTAEGARAKTAMAALVAGQVLRCTDLGPDRYGRTLGQCQRGTDATTLSEHMVEDGYCSFYGVSF
ncbi:MAG: thermonuclease family protein [Pseudomonadota bacterium]